MTKAERLKLARKVRSDAGLYLLFQKPHVRAGHSDADKIALRCLVAARDNLSKLIRIEQAQQAARDDAAVHRARREG